ncbi:MAG: GntR family transcriptional regulator [Acholeplasmataceae bacterium]|jgi:GntR family transcriptional regulator|nr:GntR family transcriptional regulator [Acholeplasmataceae bacterium]
MKIVVSMKSNYPLYEQIKNQIINLIVNAKLKPEEQLPSIRTLAKTLQVGIITVKRAYDDLVNEGYLISKEAKGYFVNDLDLAQIQKNAKRELKEKLKVLKEEALNYKIDYQTLKELLKEIYDE